MDEELTLMKKINSKDVERTTVLATVGSIMQSEYVAAAQKDIKPSYKFTIWKFEYDEQTEVEYKGIQYYVYRVYPLPNQDRIELYVEKRIGRR